MDNFIKMDVFFITATVSLVIATVLLSIVCVYAIRVMRKIDQIASIAVEESGLIKEDIDLLRADMRKRGMQLAKVVALLTKPARRIAKNVSK